VTTAAAAPSDIELVQVRREYGSVVAVDNVSLSIARGEFFSLLGPSGCGKTTLLRMIAGFVTPTAGEIRIRGRVVNNVPAYKRETNMVFQQLALFPHLNVFDNVAFGLVIKRRPRQEIRDRVGRALEQVGLVGLERRRPHELSGGQQQRVAIARAVINEPAALLLDEPLGALDLKLRNQMQLELKAMQKRLGTTFIYVTHDQGEAMTMSDRIAVMRDGHVEQLGRPDEIYVRPLTRFVAHFIGETNLFDATVLGTEGTATIVESHGLRFVTTVGAARGAAVALSLRPENVRLGPLADTATNRFPAVVQTVVFLGPQVRYELVVGQGRRIVAQAHADGRPSYAAGQALQVGWSAEHLVPLRPEEP
jgi:spermidine/putrescine transport system ATP-binding protein